MTEIYLSGAESPEHQLLLKSCGVSKVAVNIGSVLRRAGTKNWCLDMVVPDWEWIAFADGPVALDVFQELCDRVPKPPKYVFGPDDWRGEPQYLPMWDGEEEFPIDIPNGMFVNNYVFSTPAKMRQALGARCPGRMMGAMTGSSEPSIGRFDTIISAAWYASMSFGETQVWDGKKLYRYNAAKKRDMRTKHADDIAALGVNPDLVMMDRHDEVARLAIMSWNKLAVSLSGEVTATPIPSHTLNGTNKTGVAMPPVAKRHGTVRLPGLGSDSIFSTYRDGDGREHTEETTVIRSSGDPIRSCNNCHLATAGCPGFQPNAQCAYEIPVQIRTKEQLQALMEAIIEIQTQRVLQARFAEEIQGQDLLPSTGREIDLLFKTVERMKNILDNRDSFKVTVDAKAGGGMLTRLFGSNVGNNARQLPEPADPNAVIDGVIVE